MANADLYDATNSFVSGHSTITAAVAAAASGYTIKVADKGSPYYEIFDMISGLTIENKSGEAPVISGAIETLATSPSGSWTLHATVTGRKVYKYTYTANPNNVQGAYVSDNTRLFTYETYADLTAFARGEGIFLDTSGNLLYIILGSAGVTDPNGVNLKISSGNYTIRFASADNSTLRGLQIEVAGEGAVYFQSADGNTISSCTMKVCKWGAYFRNDGGGCSNNIVEDCTIVDTRRSEWSWTEVKASPMEGSGIKQACGGTANLFRRNNISGFFNGINVNKTDSSTPYVDGVRIYENNIHDIMDDGLELENYCRNVEVYLNQMWDTYNGISCTPHYDGPSYIYRNRITCDKDSNGAGRCFKGSDGQTRNNIKLYHNVFTASGNVLPMPNDTPSDITNFEIYNNILLPPANKFAINGSPFHTQAGNEYDGNIYHRISGGGNLFQDFDKNDGTERATLAAFLASAEGIASGWELNGQEGDPEVDMSSYPYTFDLTDVGSIATNAGITLPGSFPDRSIYDGDETVGWRPFQSGGGGGGGANRITGIVRAATNTSTGNQTFRDSTLTETPNAAILIITSAVTDNTAAADANFGIGFARSTSERLAFATFEDDAVATTATRRQSVENGCVLVINSAGTEVAKADFVQWEADAGSGAGMTINWSNAPEAAFLLTIIFFKATNVKVGTYLTPASNGGTVATTVSFESDVIFTVAPADSIPNSSATALISIGVGAKNLTQRCWVYRSANSAADTDVSAQYLTNRISARLQSGGAVLNATELTAVSSTDFTMTQRSGTGGTDEVGYLAMEFEGLSLWVGDVNSPTSTGIQNVTTGFFSQLIMLGLTNTEAAATAYNDNRAGSNGISAINSDVSYSNVVYSDDLAATTAAKSLSDDIAVRLPNDDGSTQNVATLSQITSTGFDLNHSAVAGTAKKWWGFALQGEEASTSHGPIFHHYYRMRRR